MKSRKLKVTPTLVSLIATLLLAHSTAGAEESAPLTSYDVELVIFRYLNPTGTPEQWSSSAESVTPKPAAGAEGMGAAPASDNSPAFPATAPTLFKLNAVADRLQRSRDYRVLAHIGWRQPGFSRDAARPMSLEGVLPAGSQVQGQVIVSRSKFLNLTLNLRLQPPELGTDSNIRIVMQETRRMRSNETHYFDHPYFGVVALITPVGASG